MHKVIFKQPKAKQKGVINKIKSFFKKPLSSFIKHEIVFYDSAENLPYRRYHIFNKYYMIAMEVGNTIGDYDKRTARAISYLNAEDYKSAARELNNRRQTLHNAIELYSNKGLALAILVYSINGVVCDNYQDDGLNETLDKLDKIGFTQYLTEQTLNQVKKK